MEFYESFVTITHAEFNKLKKEGKVFYIENRKYAKGEVAYLNGEPYMSVKDDNSLILYPANSDWKKIYFCS